MKKVGFIGLGTMGKPMALNLLKAGYPLYVNDKNPDAMKALVDAGATPCDSAKEMAEKVDVVITMLINSGIVRTVLNGEDGFLKGCHEGQIVIDMSTIAPTESIPISKIVNSYGVEFIDAPVSGGMGGAQKGTLTIMIGGKSEVVDEVKPLFEAMGKQIYFVGDIGSGVAMKIVNNMLLGANMAAVAEALVFGKKLGLDSDTMYEIIKVSSGRSFVIENKVPKFVLPREFNPGFAVDLQYKDLGLAMETAKQINVPTPMTALSTQIFQMARSEGLGKEDISAVIKVWEQMTGVTVEGNVSEN